MSHSQPFSISHNNPEADDSSTVFDADTVVPDEVLSLPPTSQEESPANTISELLRRINSQHRPDEPYTTTAIATATATRSEEISTNESSSSSSNKRSIITNNSSSHQSTKRPRRSSRLKRQSQKSDENCTDDKSDSEVEDYEPDEAVINQSSSSSSSSQTSTTKLSKFELRWKSKFEKLCAYKRSNGNVNVPQRNKELGVWIQTQRVEYRKFKKNNGKAYITKERIAMLESIGFEWVSQYKTPRNESKWNERFNELKEYKDKYGDANVPNKSKDYKQLGKWVSAQRTEYKQFQDNKKSPITLERIEMLNSIGFQWVCQNDESAWNKRFTELKAYKEKYKNTKVPKRWEVNKELGVWVHNQRRHYKKLKKNGKSCMTLERIELLNSIGFQWECRPPRS